MKKRIIPLVLVLCILLQICFGLIALSAGPFSGGTGTLRDPYIITDQTQLNRVRDYLTSNFALGNDIYMSGYFTPIGTSTTTKAFTGTFDGRDYTIFNLYISDTGHTGLFGYTNNASITNLNLAGGTVYGSSYVGSIVGYANNTIIIDNCTSSVNVNATSSNSGGLIGYANDDCRVSNSSYSGNISGKVQTGGIVGYAKRNSFSEAAPAVTKCFVTGSVSGSSDVGGIGGQVYGYITQCYTTNSVIGSSSNVGGIVGYLYSNTNTGAKVCDSYSNGYIQGTNYVGGIAGKVYESSTSGGTGINRSYSTGSIYASTNYAGGIVGGLSSSYGSVNMCVAINPSVDKYNTTKTTVGAFAGSNMRGSNNLYRSDIALWARSTRVTPSGGSSRTLDQLKQPSTYQGIGWDIGNPGSIWTIDTSKSVYPILRMQSPNVRLTSTQDEIVVGMPTQFSASPNTASNIWSSDNPLVTVDAVGCVTGKEVGATATITVTASNGSTDSCTVKVIPPETPTFSFIITLLQGESVLLTGMQGDDRIKATWESSDPTIAEVDATGRVTGLHPGIICITAYDDYMQPFRINVEVLEAIPVTGIVLEEYDLSMEIGQSVGIEYTITPENATDQRVVWASSNPDVATVEDGIISAVSLGYAVITVTTLNGAYTATIFVNVEQEVTGLAITPQDQTIIVGDTLSLTASTQPKTSKQPEVTWTVDDEDVADIMPDGTITAKKPGTVTVTAITKEGLSGVTTVTVRELVTETLSEWRVIPQKGPYMPSSTYNGMYARLTGEGVTITDGASSSELRSTGWNFAENNVRAWQVEFTTTGFAGITISSVQTANNKSPNNFILEYSLDGYNWTPVAVEHDEADEPVYEYRIRDALDKAATEKSLLNIPLPSECDNQPRVLARWRSINDLGPNDAVSATAPAIIKNIVIKGQH